MKKSYLLLILGIALAIMTSCKKKETATPPTSTVNPTPTPVGGVVQSMPYSVSFTENFGTYTTKDVSGTESWMIDFKSAKMTGYVNDENRENEDWLISSPVKVIDVEHAKISMEYICRYFNNLSNDITLWASYDYTFGDMPDQATWTQISASLESSSSWTDWKTVDISIDDFIGDTITVAVKYLSNTTKAGTIEVKSIVIQEGQGSGPTPPGPTPGPGTGSGTADDPYDVAKGISLQGQQIVGWTQGYIVGAAKKDLSTVSSNDDIVWAAPFDSYTNVVIADDATCHDISQCIIVNLTSNTPLRSQVNLYDNAGNLGKKLAVNGKLRAYFGQAGLRDSNGTEDDFVLEGGVTPPPTPTGFFSESFANGQGEFTIQDVNLPSALTYVWIYDSRKFMKANAYANSTNYESESWLISPSIDMSAHGTAVLTFDHAVNYLKAGVPEDFYTVMVSTDYVDGDVSTATWTQVTVPNYPLGDSWTWFASGNVVLDAFAGQPNVHIAFKYTSEADNAGCWEVKNVVVSE